MKPKTKADAGPAETGTPRGPEDEHVLTRGLRAVAPAALLTALVIIVFLAVIGILAITSIVNVAFIVARWPTAYIPFWTAPLWNSLILTVVAYGLGFIAAIGLGFARAYGAGKTRNKVATIFYAPVTAYVDAIRGTPFFVQIWLIFFFVDFTWPQLNMLGRDVYFWAGLLALTLNTIGYQTEVFRGGFQSVAQGQIEAAKAIGLRGPQVFRHITLPQGLRLVVLPLTNEFISLFKASSIVSYIAVYELFHWSQDLGQTFGHPIEGFLMISLYFLLINIPLSRGVTYIEQKYRVSGLGSLAPEKTFMARFVGRISGAR